MKKFSIGDEVARGMYAQLQDKKFTNLFSQDFSTLVKTAEDESEEKEDEKDEEEDSLDECCEKMKKAVMEGDRESYDECCDMFREMLMKNRDEEEDDDESDNRSLIDYHNAIDHVAQAADKLDRMGFEKSAYAATRTMQLMAKEAEEAIGSLPTEFAGSEEDLLTVPGGSEDEYSGYAEQESVKLRGNPLVGLNENPEFLALLETMDISLDQATQVLDAATTVIEAGGDTEGFGYDPGTSEASKLLQSSGAQKILFIAQEFIKQAAAKKKTDPDAKVRNRPDPVFDAKHPKVKDNKDHFPLGDIDQARNAVAMAFKYKKAPKWYDGNLESLQKAVIQKVKKKYPFIKIESKP